ncbi:Acyl-CoA dehydrogenase OS=Streptomyces antimycoticus OX=68175 GN=SANT12839_026050 PE=3 SV=1 [Streptomyces antimycoticus]
MASGEVIGCFGLTEPDHGSDPAGMRTYAKRDGSDWVITGRKMWITNGSVAGVAVVWARTDEGIRGFVVPTDAPGFAAPDIKHKWSLRASVTSELVLDEVRLPADAVLPEVTGLRGPLKLSGPRPLRHHLGRRWGPPAPRFEAALDYARDREQFGRPIGGFQLTQAKLADMALELHKGILLAHHLGRRMAAGRLRPEQVSFGKLNNVREAIEICRTSRTITGRQRDLAGVSGDAARHESGVGAHL